MIPLFLGLTAANLLLLSTIFALGLAVSHGDGSTTMYQHHVTWAVAAGLLATLCHSVVYTYFMATSKWLAAAADKAGLDAKAYITAPSNRKKMALFIIMTPVLVTMLTMCGGAAADTFQRWPAGLHLGLGIATLLVNLGAAVWEFRLIRAQGKTMDQALAILNQRDDIQVGHA